MIKLSLLLSTLAVVSMASPLRRSTDITTVNLDQCSGSPQLYSQGVLYGMTGNETPPQQYLTDLAINYESAGGAQTDPQPAGYASSMTSYEERFNATIQAYQRIKSVDGVMIVKMADLWGADETTSSSFLWPGDDGNWTKYQDFLQQVSTDLQANGMVNAYTTQLECWNEPDINFGGRDQSQFNEMWQRCVDTLRNTFGKDSSLAYLPIVGPSTAANPNGGNSWWDSYLSFLQSNGGTSIQPDVWNWHMEGGGNNDPIPPADYLPGYIEKYGLTTGLGLQNNEYGTKPQQTPSMGAWFKARYERLQFHALRGNWASEGELSNDLAGLLVQDSNGNYQTTGEYQMYKFYKEMTGSPCTSTEGTNVDSFATASSNSVIALVGSQSSSSASVGITFDSISTYFGSATSISAQLINIPYNNGTAVNGWTNSGSPQTLSVSNNQVTFTFAIDSDQVSDAWAVQLSPA